MDTEQTDLNIQRALGALRRRAPWIVLCCVLAAGAAYAVSKRETRKYTATAAVVFNENSLSQQIAGLPGGSNISPLTQQADNLELVRLGNMAAKTATLLGHGLTAEQVAASISVAAQGESSDVDVSATMTSPTLAAAVANTYVHLFVDAQKSGSRKYFTSALALVNKQLAALRPAQRFGPVGLTLQDRAQALSLLSELDYNNVQVAQEAPVPAGPSSPRTSKNTLIGGALGLLLGLSLAFVLERLDRRIRRPEELEEIYGAPLLGVVPESAALRRVTARNSVGAALAPTAEAEAFNLIRAHLRLLNVERDVRAIAITAATEGDGKTTVAVRLAEAAARLGARVLLLELDMRHPTLARQLNIQSGPGLIDVLSGDISLYDAAQHVDLVGSNGDGAMGRALDVLAAGTLVPSNPGALLGSRASAVALEQGRSTYDLVVMDMPSLTTVSDAFPLLTKVDGVVIVGRVGRGRRDAAKRLYKVLAGSGVPILGVIANGVKPGRRGPFAARRPGGRDSRTGASGGGPPAAIASSNGASPAEELASTTNV